MSIGLLGYSFSALLFLLLSILLLTSWRGRIEGAVLFAAVAVTCLWAISAAYLTTVENTFSTSIYQIFEVLRSVLWLGFLLKLLQSLKQAVVAEQQTLAKAQNLVLLLSSGVLVFLLLYIASPAVANWKYSSSLLLLGSLMLSVAGLMLIEQLIRNTRQEMRWAVKYLYFGTGCLFAYDFFLYADALLFMQVDYDFWQARGFTSSLAVPLIAVAAARNPDWSVKVFVSRRAVFHASVLLGAGLYLLLMSGTGYYIRLTGGSWGKAAQAIFLSMALLFLLAILFSSYLRSRAKVFLSKHFFNYKYDYRDEWLKINNTLAGSEPGQQIRQQVIKGLADLVDSGGGILWLKDNYGYYHCVSGWNVPTSPLVMNQDSSLIFFLQQRDWIVDLKEFQQAPDLYDDLELPDELLNIDMAWLLVPIKQQGDLIAFVLLIKPRAPRQINWEDRDLLKTAAQQTGSYLALMKASEALTRANQFEAFNRLSAFVVHDLKNMLAQLELLVKNAEQHKNNPEFMDDAISTVNNAAKKMQRLLGQLRKGRFETGSRQIFNLTEALEQVITEQHSLAPKPVLTANHDDLQLAADRERFVTVVGHLVKNAQEATAEDGEVVVTLDRDGDNALIRISDTGAGMDSRFIRERLFQPFETTKGNAGMGIGVYESSEFVRQLNGNIDVESEPGSGTSFTLTLPAHVTIPTSTRESLLEKQA